MEAKEVRDLMEAYASMYSQVISESECEDEEESEEEETPKMNGKKKEKKEKEKLDEVKVATTTQNDRIPNFETEKKAKQVPGLRVNKPSSPVEEEVDLFDYLLEYLVAEGYADTNKAALAIMANMSEEWKQSIVEQDLTARQKYLVKKVGDMNAQKSGSAHTAIPGKQNAGAALDRANRSAMQMRGV